MQDLLEYLNKRIREESGLQKRALLRRDMIKAIINSYPPNTPIPMREFASAIGFRPLASSIYMILSKMVKDGEIAAFGGRSGGPPRTYTVLKPGNTYDQERATSPGEVGQVSEVTVDEQTNLVEKGEYLMEKTYTFEELEKLAIKACFYAGQNLEVSQFLLWLKEAKRGRD